MIKNESLLFILPMLGDYTYNKNLLVNKDLYGVFINDVDKTSMYDCILLAYNYHKNYSFDTDLLITDHLEYVGTYFPSTSKIIYIFNIPEHYKEDYCNILNGNYNNLSKEYIAKLIEFWVNEESDPKKNIIYNLFVQNENLEDIYKQYNRNKEASEVWYKPILEAELFDIVEAK
jgi:hypothetical protein